MADKDKTKTAEEGMRKAFNYGANDNDEDDKESPMGMAARALGVVSKEGKDFVKGAKEIIFDE